MEWVYKVNYYANGEVKKYKPELVARGYLEAECIEYEDTFAPIASHVLVSFAWISELRSFPPNTAIRNGETGPFRPLAHTDLSAPLVLASVNSLPANAPDLGALLLKRCVDVGQRVCVVHAKRFAVLQSLLELLLLCDLGYSLRS